MNFLKKMINRATTTTAVVNIKATVTMAAVMMLLVITSLAFIGISPKDSPETENAMTAAVEMTTRTSLDNCFAAKTPIHTDKGAVNIENIKVGDKVLSWNAETKQAEYKSVFEVFTEETEQIVKLSIKNESKAVEATPEHPFYTRTVKRVRENTTAPDEGEWVEARHLAAGDLVRTAAGAWQQVLSVETISRAETVYNFEVEDNHNYYVGGAGFLVHNDCRRESAN